MVDQRYFERNLPNFIRENGVTDLLFINNIFAANTAVQIQWIQSLLTKQYVPPLPPEESSSSDTESSSQVQEEPGSQEDDEVVSRADHDEEDEDA